VRDSRSASINGKMSEYSAAVGLAELDGWDDKYLGWSAVAGFYRDAMQAVQLSKLLSVHPIVSTCYTVLMCRTAEQAHEAEKNLDERRIDCRRWYGAGVQSHSYYSGIARDTLEVSSDVLPRLLGLPVAPDLSRSDVDRVVTALRPALSG
jgi:dTDP-4-amino-4,6-dideoxygalactose transaminase